MENEFGLGDKNLAAIVGVLHSVRNVSRAIIYGSRAKGNYRHNSDIDITLEGDGLTLTDLAILDGKLDDLLLPWQFDLSIKSRITNAALLAEIDKYGKTVYERETGPSPLTA